LQDRSAAGNSRRGAIFVSVHYNYNRGGSGAGAETYYHFSSSYMLAAYIQAYLVQRTSMTNRGVKSAGFHVIRATSKNPAVLVECGFRQQFHGARPHDDRRVSRPHRRGYRAGHHRLSEIEVSWRLSRRAIQRL
jgi:N-acetylmuramoyl-L-alanine amidase